MLKTSVINNHYMKYNIFEDQERVFFTHLMVSPVFVCNKCSGITQSFEVLIGSCISIGMILCI